MAIALLGRMKATGITVVRIKTEIFEDTGKGREGTYGGNCQACG
jgi:hypothetical protein